MSNVAINSLPVIEARLQVTRQGAWTSDVVVDAETAAQVATGSRVNLTLANGAISFLGTVYRGDPYAQTVTLKVVGGANGLSKKCAPRFYNPCAIRLPLADLLKDAGETLSPDSDQSTLGAALSGWAMLRQDVALALSSLADAGPEGAIWRVQPDGSVFFGVDSYPVSALQDFELVDYMPQEGLQVIAAEVPNVFPGQTFNSRKVSAVEHVIHQNGSRARVWFDGV